MRVLAALILALALTTPLARAQTLVMTPAQQRAIDALAQEQLAAQKAAGFTLAVARGGQILYEQAYGRRNIASRLAAHVTTVYAIGSLTKQFTAAAAMLLVQDGRLDLDAKVAQYLPDAPHASEITVRQLLFQTSGLPDYLNLLSGRNVSMDPKVSPQTLVALVANHPLLFAPGSDYSYSNTNYLLLGLIIEKQSGTSLANLTQRRIFDPFRMLNTSWGTPNGTDVATGYTPGANGLQVDPARDMSFAFGAGAMWSTVDDLVKWDDAFFHGRIVTPQSVTTLTTSGVRTNGTATQYAGGWIVGREGGHPIIWHNGGIGGFSSRNAYFPDDNVEIVVLANTISFDATPFVRGILGTLFPSQSFVRGDPLPSPQENPAIGALAPRLLTMAQTNAWDTSVFDAALQNALTPAMRAQVAGVLPSGAPTSLRYLGANDVEGRLVYTYLVTWPSGRFFEEISQNPDGKVHDYLIVPAPSRTSQG